jgi:sterol desaturase/sphingolipid hydroxylase (fatty acid hydroxylase superfamily)
MHRWHHAASLGAPGANFATKLAIWDWLFGTGYLPEHKADDYGLWDHAPFPDGFIQQQLFAFRSFDPELAVERPSVIPNAATTGDR